MKTKYVIGINQKVITITKKEDDVSKFTSSLSINKKRFLNIKTHIVNALEYLSDNDITGEVFKTYLIIRGKFKKDTTLDHIYFAEVIKRCLLNDELKRIAEKYVDENYTIVKFAAEKDVIKKDVEELDTIITADTEKKDLNKDLLINDEHAKDLEKISFVMKIVIPLITDFHISGRFSEDVYMLVFKEILNMFNDNNIIEKLTTFINSRICYTKAADTKMWTILRHESYNLNNAGLDMFTKIVTLILYKLDVNQYPISLIHAALKRQLLYVFNRQFNTGYSSFIGVNENNDGVSNFDKFSTKKYDEGSVIISKVNKSNALKDIINEFKNKYNLTVSNNEYKYYYDKLELTNLQVNLIYLFYSKFMNTSNFSLSKEEYVILSVLAYKYLSLKKMKKIASVMLSVYVGEELDRPLQKKDIALKLDNTKLYKEVIEEKYSHIKDKIIQSNKNPIINLITGMYYSNWRPIPTYENQDMKVDLLNIESNPELLCYETLIFVYDLI